MVKKNITNASNANVFLNGDSQLGKADEVSVSADYRFSEKKPLGMMTATEFFTGLDKIEAKIKWNSFYADVLKKTANPLVNVNLQIRSNVELWEGDELTGEVPMVIHLRAKQRNMPNFGFKQGDPVENESTFRIVYVKIVDNGATILEIDVENLKFVVDGTDIWSKYRVNLGLS